jgi:AAA domain
MPLNDEIYAWLSERPGWQQELFLRALAGNRLSEESQDRIIDLVLHGSDEGTRTVQRDDLPTDLRAGTSLRLLAIEHVMGVNRLVDGEVLSFIADGLNVVYGANGSGKSGWARIPKHAGRAEHDERILGDAFTPEAERPRPIAAIRSALAGDERRVELALDEPAPGDLAGMCVFDGHCGVQLLRSAHEVEFVPVALEALRRLYQAQGQVASRIDHRIGLLRDDPLDLTPFGAETLVSRALKGLSHETDLSRVRAHAQVTAEEEVQRNRLAREVAAIDADKTEELATNAERVAKRAEELVEELRRIAVLVDADAIAAHTHEIAMLEAARTLAQRLSAEQFERAPLGGVGSEPWLVMWKAVQAFMHEIHETRFPPGDKGLCALCMQNLEPEAQARLQGFDTFVRSDVEQQLKTAQAAVSKRKERLPDPAATAERHAAALEELPDAISDKVRLWLESVTATVDEIRSEASRPTPPPTAPTDVIDEFARKERVRAAGLHSLKDPEVEARLRSELAEANARHVLGAHVDDIGRRVDRLQQVERLNAARAQLTTSAISNAMRKFARAFITDDLETALHAQLKALNFGDVEIVRCATSGSEGTPQVGLKVQTQGRASLQSILSEGEQRRLALAFFLAEVSVAYKGQPLILDDPVCSVDSEGRRHIARTLARIAKDRQVIVFTHELTFLHELEAAAEAEQVHRHMLSVLRDASGAGRVQPDLPWVGLGAEDRYARLGKDLKEIQRLYGTEGPSETYRFRAIDYSTLLRQAFERAVEDKVLGGVVTRGRPGVHIGALDRVAWSPEIVHLADRGLDEMSPWVHDGSRASAAAPPTPDEFSEGLDVLDQLLRRVSALRRDRHARVTAERQIPGTLRNRSGELLELDFHDGVA